MGFFDKIANLFKNENDDNWDSPFSALLSDENRARLDQLNEIQRHYGTSPFIALLDDKSLDKLYRMRDRYNDPYKALNAKETEYDLNAMVKEKLSEELRKFRNVCQKVGTQNQQGLEVYSRFDVKDYQDKKRTIVDKISRGEMTYSEMIDGVFWMINEYPKQPYDVDKKYFPSFRHDANPLKLVEGYRKFHDFYLSELKRCGFDKEKWKKNYHRDQCLLDNPKTLLLAEVFATFLARKAIELQDLGSIRYCVDAYAEYNADRILENGFDIPVIVPRAFKNPHFKALLQKDGATNNLPLLEADTVRDWLLNMKKEKNLFNTPPLLQEDWEKIFEKWSFPEIQNSVCGIDNEASIEQMKQYRAQSKANAVGKADGIFVDVDGTLIYHDRFNEKLYNVMQLLKNKEKVKIFTGGDVDTAKKKLQKFGVDTNAFPVESKENYRNFLFTGFVIDDISPERQAFWMDDDEKYIPPYSREGKFDSLIKATMKYVTNGNEPLETLYTKAKKEHEKEDVIDENYWKKRDEEEALLKSMVNNLKKQR